ncbi:uncharacterized protein, partial [Montipora capricornis]|uniref:uncharacterized protein n=1 Tax=Montipora capricornis TaxID=246305 RepID=UPI0035F1ABC3
MVDDHYQLALPWCFQTPCLPNNRSVAARRLQALKKRFLADPVLFENYKDTIDQYIANGHARKVLTPDDPSPGKLWYLPYHPVFHPGKHNKVRVVFDFAARFRETSLNDQLLQGPDLTSNLTGVLLRFRQEPIALVADVEQMFHQVRVKPEDCDILRFLWWEYSDFTKGVVDHQMLVHLFGASSSPCCASFALKKTENDNKSSFDVLTIDTVNRNFYVDDCLKSVSTVPEAHRLVSQLSNLLAQGGFHLTKWISNCREVLKSIPAHERAPSIRDLDLEDLPLDRALGTQWDVERDTLSFKVAKRDVPSTRRGMLSLISGLYDPLGFAAPFILPAKTLLQELCRQDFGWDEQIPDEKLLRWRNWASHREIHQRRFDSQRNYQNNKRSIESYLQREAFPKELVLLQRITQEPTRRSSERKRLRQRLNCIGYASPLRKLSSFLHDGVICVGGRLNNASMPFSAKHPMILPSKHPVTDLIIKDYHEKEGHVGACNVLESLRQSFWILRGNAAVRRVLGKCLKCRFWNSSPCDQIMAQLPCLRVSPFSPPFSSVGVDFFGPILVKEKRSHAKRYGCVFTCLTFRAAHIEVAHDLTSDSFIQAFTRFVSRRGAPIEVFSDNGTNFRGAETEIKIALRKWNPDRISTCLRRRGVQWYFNPPLASHTRGVWERMIRSIRKILRLLLGNQLVDDQTPLTFIAEVEKILNDRPLVPPSSDPRDPEPLSPSAPKCLLSSRRNARCQRPVWGQTLETSSIFSRHFLETLDPIIFTYASSVEKCPAQVIQEIAWAATAAAGIDIQPCPNGASDQSSHRWLPVKRERRRSLGPTREANKPNNKNVTRPTEIYGGDLLIAVDILVQLAEYNNASQGSISSEEHVKDLSQVVSNLLEPENALTWLGLEQEGLGRGRALVNAVDDYGLGVAATLNESTKTRTVATKNLKLTIKRITPESP